MVLLLHVVNVSENALRGLLGGWKGEANFGKDFRLAVKGAKEELRKDHPTPDTRLETTYFGKSY